MTEKQHEKKQTTTKHNRKRQRSVVRGKNFPRAAVANREEGAGLETKHSSDSQQ